MATVICPYCKARVALEGTHEQIVEHDVPNTDWTCAGTAISFEMLPEHNRKTREETK